jgi:hypothetical protein
LSLSVAAGGRRGRTLPTRRGVAGGWATTVGFSKRAPRGWPRPSLLRLFGGSYPSGQRGGSSIGLVTTNLDKRHLYPRPLGRESGTKTLGGARYAPRRTHPHQTRNQKHLRKPTTSNPDESGVLEPKTLKTAQNSIFCPFRRGSKKILSR